MYYLIIYLFPSGWHPPPSEGLGEVISFRMASSPLWGDKREVIPISVNAIPTSGNAIPSSGNGLRRYGRSHASPVNFIDIAVEHYGHHHPCSLELLIEHPLHCGGDGALLVIAIVVHALAYARHDAVV